VIPEGGRVGRSDFDAIVDEKLSALDAAIAPGTTRDATGRIRWATAAQLGEAQQRFRENWDEIPRGFQHDRVGIEFDANSNWQTKDQEAIADSVRRLLAMIPLSLVPPNGVRATIVHHPVRGAEGGCAVTRTRERFEAEIILSRKGFAAMTEGERDASLWHEFGHVLDGSNAQLRDASLHSRDRHRSEHPMRGRRTWAPIGRIGRYPSNWDAGFMRAYQNAEYLTPRLITMTEALAVSFEYLRNPDLAFRMFERDPVSFALTRAILDGDFSWSDL
jgi:hypothetical protein